ncbi:MAG: hypothetical protein JXQ99_23320 [Hyphomicrobiaceae bacterium]
MVHQLGQVLAAVSFCALLLSACSGGPTPPTLTGALPVQPSSLSLSQQATITAAAREMTGDQAAAVHGLKARTDNDKSVIHVCGYVKTPANASTPLYVELRETDGASTAERGQIGATPANLAKVRFMCRQHGDW